MMLSLFRFFFCSLVVSLPLSCGNPKDAKLPIGENLAGPRFLVKVPQTSPNFPKDGDTHKNLFFLANTNNSNKYKTGSIQVYDTKNVSKPLLTKEIPNFVTSLDVIHDKYVVLTFQLEGEEGASKMEIWEYSFDATTFVTMKRKQTFELTRSKEERIFRNEKKMPLQVISSILAKDINSSSKKSLLVLSCRHGELVTLDVTDLEADKWKAPVHVRNYGENVARQAMVVKDDFLLLFPASSELRTQVPVGSYEYDKEEVFMGVENGPPYKEGVPESKSKSAESLKETTSYYQLAVYDLEQEAQFKSLDQVYVGETFWLHFPLEGAVPAADKKYLRTNFLRAKPARPDSGNKDFYVTHRHAKQQGLDEHEILKLTVEDLTAFRGHLTTESAKKVDEQVKFNFLANLKVQEKPVFKMKDEEKALIGGNPPKQYMFYDFEVLLGPKFFVLSYKNTANYYALLEGEGSNITTKNEANSITQSDWCLLVFPSEYVTIQNSYKNEVTIRKGIITP